MLSTKVTLAAKKGRQLNGGDGDIKDILPDQTKKRVS